MKNNLRQHLRVKTSYDYSGDEPDNTHLTGEQEPPTKDHYITKIIKYIPGEIVAAFLFAMATVGEYTDGTTNEEGVLSNADKLNLYWWIFWILLVLTPIYRYLAISNTTRLKLDISALVQSLIAAIAFIAWVYALGGPFDHYDNDKNAWHSTKGALVLLGATLTLPLLEVFIGFFKRPVQ